MIFSLLIRWILWLALVCNGLQTAYASVQLPLLSVALAGAGQAHALPPVMRGHGCHDEARADETAAQRSERPLKKTSVTSTATSPSHSDCAKPGACHCVCAAPVGQNAGVLNFAVTPARLLQPTVPTPYVSIAGSRRLRPPIA